jgi:hypothetical protein
MSASRIVSAVGVSLLFGCGLPPDEMTMAGSMSLNTRVASSTRDIAGRSGSA